MTDADDFEAQLAHEQFQDYRTCINCGLHAWHDPTYKPMRVAWKDWCYTDQIKQEVALIAKKYDTEIDEADPV